ncbi:MAG: hypothetical protein A3D24_01110 [Candidatus Blackburnbacteria bacterium RIFCSPHIGHO2_02_FULL_39_13]|uniref:S-adenosylmethionine decarboxylase proenzyme n=1 Tax=Candidatus Blackburnbacteria bacterium RIFCSPLOWO2_01_FULL_40_20 TaxID=1797519 RepID=A0A1G1VFF7_9BACT|nr:MAG: S-adenosylmethionine decarboxylase proenzyme [Microgenomates group bacterium GW2011_GWA2_39_19]OGY07299.1 MAG: hypothetical protein A2694_04290 [Candidatus Blackburnbacteria bacterium RIFCSPHIGHO2_01_FULL_40_17]OGY08059.1 MAG: hypothetical protein A3D24_01110 [Candidatus Blackburnbacteria bacterium RIFCSPHIGHO2_02_FULL_39_13]OGY14148.1 MAG: hypothetical protein A3A77_04790 [Candidatus Blackburnbacteria bacterium RIFCSPLOWO2_01_FULL_40_20]OGY15444.1 MAG: hypothetical protein A3I52_01915 
MQQKRYHIIVDVENCPPEKVNDTTFVKNFLEKLPEKIGMSILYGPVVMEGIPKNPGLSGFLIIDYSHISIHTFASTNEFLIDIFSCKPYDQDTVVNFFLSLVPMDRKNLNIKTVAWG